MSQRRTHFQGFTLVELLIGVMILGEIATFTIPKVVNAQKVSSSLAIAKETAGNVSAAYQAYRLQNTVTASTGITNLTPYLNYVKIDSTSTVDSQGGYDTDCSNTGYNYCLRMHNGSVFVWYNGETFGGTQSNNVVHVCVDPDGTNNAATTNDPGAGLCFLLYYDGRLTTRNNALPNSISGKWGSFDPVSDQDPAWFTW